VVCWLACAVVHGKGKKMARRRMLDADGKMSSTGNEGQTWLACVHVLGREGRNGSRANQPFSLFLSFVTCESSVCSPPFFRPQPAHDLDINGREPGPRRPQPVLATVGGRSQDCRDRRQCTVGSPRCSFFIFFLIGTTTLPQSPIPPSDRLSPCLHGCFIVFF